MKYVKQYEEIEWPSFKGMGSRLKDAFNKLGIKCDIFKYLKEYHWVVPTKTIVHIPGSTNLVLHFYYSKRSGSSLECRAEIFFKENSSVAKILKTLGRRQMFFLEEQQYYMDQGTTSNKDGAAYTYNISIKKTFEIQKNEDLLKFINKVISEMSTIKITEIINKINELEIAADRKIQRQKETKVKSTTIEEMSSTISDYLAELEDISTSHNSEMHEESLYLEYNIVDLKCVDIEGDVNVKGISGIILNPTIINIMKILETFQSRLKKDLQDINIEIKLMDEKITIVIHPSKDSIKSDRISRPNMVNRAHRGILPPPF